MHSFSLTFTSWTYFTEHEPSGASQEEYKKEQMNLKKMFLSLDLKRKVSTLIFSLKATTLHFECMFVYIRYVNQQQREHFYYYQLK